MIQRLMVLFMVILLVSVAPVSAKVIQIQAGIDQIAAAYADADSGDVIELVTSGGRYIETGKLKVKKTLTIRGMECLEEKPIIETHTNSRPFEPRGGCAGFWLENVRVTGLVNDGVTDSKDSTKYAMRTRKMDGVYELGCRNVDFDHFGVDEGGSYQGYVLRVDDDATFASEIWFENCTFDHVAKHALRIDEPTQAPGQFALLRVENCTFSNVMQRCLDCDLVNEAGVDSAVVMFNHCTFYNVGDDALKLNQGFDFTVKNTIFNTITDNIITADSAEAYTEAAVSYCDTLNTNGFGDFLDLATTDIYAEDPEFADPENLDFTVSDFFASLAIGDDGLVVGDLLWDPANPVENCVIQIAAGNDQINWAYDMAGIYSGSIIELTTSGGRYVESDKIKVKRKLTIRGAEGLANKPIIEFTGNGRPFEPRGGCTGFYLKDLRVTGLVNDGVTDSQDSTKYAFRARKMDGVYEIICENVDFDNFGVMEGGAYQGYVMRVDDDAVYAKQLVFDSCTFTNIGKHVFRIDEPTEAPGQFGLLHVQNCTFANVLQRCLDTDLIMEDGVDPAKIHIDHCTFNNVGDDALKINQTTDATLKNSIFTNINDNVITADSAEVYTAVEVSYCDTLNTNGFGTYVDLITNTIYGEDPEYRDPENLDFTVSEFFASLATGDDGLVVGDLRWIPEETAVAVADALPRTFKLEQNYPNPFNPTTSIEYTLPHKADVKVYISNLIGRRIATLVDAEQTTGQRAITWNAVDEQGQPVSSGVYFCTIKAGDSFTKTIKMLLVR